VGPRTPEESATSGEAAADAIAQGAGP